MARYVQHITTIRTIVLDRQGNQLSDTTRIEAAISPEETPTTHEEAQSLGIDSGGFKLPAPFLVNWNATDVARKAAIETRIKKEAGLLAP